jgi:hypothetical protein
VLDESTTFDDFDTSNESDETDISDRCVLLELTVSDMFDNSDVFDMLPELTETAELLIFDDSETSVFDESNISDDFVIFSVFAEFDISEM